MTDLGIICLFIQISWLFITFYSCVSATLSILGKRKAHKWVFIFNWVYPITQIINFWIWHADPFCLLTFWYFGYGVTTAHNGVFTMWGYLLEIWSSEQVELFAFCQPILTFLCIFYILDRFQTKYEN